jgi:hypothetical protein
MARRNKSRQIVTALETVEALTMAVEESDKKLVGACVLGRLDLGRRLPFAVLDVHTGWVGPCAVMAPMFDSVTLLIESWADRLKLCSVRSCLAPQLTPPPPDWCPQIDKALLPEDLVEKYAVDMSSSKPYFVVLKVRASLPSGLPSLRCCCRSLQQRVVLGKISGANAPELRSIITENVPPPPEKDE